MGKSMDVEKELEDFLGADEDVSSEMGEDEVATGEEVTAEAEQEEAEPEGDAEADAEEPETPSEEEPWTKTAYLDEKRKRQELASKLEALKGEIASLRDKQPEPEPEPVPDMLDDPEGFAAHQARQQRALQLSVQEDIARDRYGDEEVDAGFKFFERIQGTAEAIAIQQARNPVREMMKAYERSKAQDEIGDPKEFAERVKKEAAEVYEAKIKDLTAKIEQLTSTAGLPGSLAGEPSKGRTRAPEWTGPETLDEILG